MEGVCVHQIWLQGESLLPKKYHPHLASYRKMCRESGIKHKLWDDKQIRKLIATHFPSVMKTYNSYPYWVMRVDLGKYLILYHHGGFYVDMDTTPRKSFRELIQDRPLVSSFNIRDLPRYSKFAWIKDIFTNNNFLYSPYQHHPFYALLIRRAQQSSPRMWWDLKIYYIVSSTGPLFIGDVVKEYTEEYGADSIGLINDRKIKEYFQDFTHTTWLDNSKIIDLDSYDRTALTVLVLVLVLAGYCLYRTHDLFNLGSSNRSVR